MGKCGLVNRFNMQKYQGKPRLIEKELNRRFKPGEFVFVQDMSDLFADTVPDDLILSIFNHIERFPKTKFLLQTKNPERYINLASSIPQNCILGTTIETNYDLFDTPSQYRDYAEISRAPFPIERFWALEFLKDLSTFSHDIFISIEPILDFDKESIEFLKAIKPWAVAVGYDNYGHKLPEPPLDKTLKLIEELEKFTKVYRKTIRKAWWE